MPNARNHATADGYVECSECGHAIEQHNHRYGCNAVLGCPCFVTLTVREIGEIRASNGLPRRYRLSELGG